MPGWEKGEVVDMVIRWGTAWLALVIVPGIVGAAPALGDAADVHTAQADVCGDVVSQAVCLTYTLVFGPDGVLPFTQTEAAWAVRTVNDVVGGI
ncbi:MAG: hypothetical protein LC624_11105 [Halobacteriales archaeon]|nr:hypothetical protein [Halobacteriales archaeon]